MASRAASLMLARTMARPVFDATWRAGAVLYACLGLIAAVVLYGNGVRPSDIVDGMQSSLVVRGMVLPAWIGTTLPVARASLLVPSTHWLRSLPAHRSSFVVVHGLVLLGVELPLALLVAAGGGGVAGLGVALVLVGAHALLTARPFKLGNLATAIVLAAGLSIPAGPAQLAAGLLAAVLGLRIAVERAPEQPRPRHRVRFPRQAAAALAVSHGLRLWRRESGTLARGILIALGGGAVASLAIRNNALAGEAGAWRVLLACGGATLPAACAGVAASALRGERRDRWLLDASGIGGSTRLTSGAGAVGLWGACLGAAQGLLAITTTASSWHHRLLATAAQAGWGAAVGMLLFAALRWRMRGDAGDGERVLVAGLVATAAAATGGALLGWVVPVLFAIAAAGLLTLQRRLPVAVPSRIPPLEEPP